MKTSTTFQICKVEVNQRRLTTAFKSRWGCNLIAGLDDLQLLGLHAAWLPAVLAPRLELVDEFINHVPEPFVGELHIDVPVENNAEEVAVILP